MRLPVAVLITLLAGAAFAQSADSPRRNLPRGGTVTNPPISGSVAEPGAATASPEAPIPHGVQREIHQPDSSVKQQSEARHRQALEQCRALSGESRIDCVRRADRQFKGAAGSDDTLSDRGPDPR
jgi:hypothetical protein